MDEQQLVEAMAKAMHDGPLLADAQTFGGSEPQEIKTTEWCIEMAKTALAVAKVAIRDDLAKEIKMGYKCGERCLNTLANDQPKD